MPTAVQQLPQSTGYRESSLDDDVAPGKAVDLMRFMEWANHLHKVSNKQRMEVREIDLGVW